MTSPKTSPKKRSVGSRKVIITCGTGGVGKTTMSTAIAIQAALEGKRTIVVTIDPAKRLATSLGLESLGDHPTDLTSMLTEACRKIDHPAPTGTLEALMPDTRKTLEMFFTSLSPTPAIAEKIIRNPIFEIFAKEFSGANEYMALERLDSLVQTGKYDCIVLDTPPNRNTVAFLNTPQLLARFFDEGLIKWLVLPANKIIATGMKKALGILESLTGSGFVGHLFDFASSLMEIQNTFTAKVKRVSVLLHSSDVALIMVTGPSPETLPEFEHFTSTVRKANLVFDGLVVNRTLGSFAVQDSELATASGELKRALETLRALQEREQAVTAKLANLVQSDGKAFYAEVPELTRDVHSLEDLFHVSRKLGEGLENAV